MQIQSAQNPVDVDTQQKSTQEADPANSDVAPQSCSSCEGGEAARHLAPTSFVYALGHVEVRFPRLCLEKEFAQLVRVHDSSKMAEPALLHSVLSKKENRYLLRQLCFVLSIRGLETYILYPRDSFDFDLLLEAVRIHPSPGDLDLVIGIRTRGFAPQNVCNGLMVPIVIVDQMYSFTRKALEEEITRKNADIPSSLLNAASGEVFDLITQSADNAGATDEQRALNYLSVRCDAIYVKTAERHSENYSLSSVDARKSVFRSTRKVVEVIFSYTNRLTGVIDKFHSAG